MLVVGSADRADLYEAADRAHARLGIEVNPVIRSAREWSDTADALLADIAASSHPVVLDHDRGETSF